MKIKVNKLPKSEVELNIVVDETDFAKYHDKGFARVQEMVEVDGFRKGNATEDAIVKKYGEMIILEEMANLALRDAYVKAIDEEKLSPITEPNVTITKLAKGNPLEMTIKVTLMPEFELPTYKKISKDVGGADEKLEVTDKDIDDVIEELRKGRVTQAHHDHDHDHAGHDHDHAGHDHAHDEATPEAVLPEVNDEFAQSFGPDFKSLADLKSKVGENLKLEKEQKAREKRRTAIVEKLINETKVELPEAIVESELSSMLAQMRADITRFGGTWEEYLSHSKKTEEVIKADWRKDAEKRAASQLILHKIAVAEKLTATDEEIEVELVRLLATVQDADENRAKSYLYQALTNEKVLKFLEESK
ncbi:MAG: trigger factor [Candidatus Paceibacterota bacterium]